MFVTSNFASQIAAIEAGLRKPVIFVGALKPRRDYSDVRGIIRGYWMLLERGEPGEVYNLCSGGHGRSSRCSTSTWEQSHTKGIAVEIDRERLRPSDVMLLQGDSSKIRRYLGSEAEIPFEHTLKDLLAYWLQRVESPCRYFKWSSWLCPFRRNLRACWRR